MMMNLIFKKETKLPFARDTSNLFLPWMVMLMVFLATMTLAGSLSVSSMIKRWNKDITGSLTVQVMPPSSMVKNQKEKIQSQIETALVVLQDTKNVQTAIAIKTEKIQNLLKPWLGETSILGDLPLPRLIDVTIEEGKEIDLNALEKNLQRHVPNASLDNHRKWLNRLVSFAKGLNNLAISVLILVILATSATVVYATRTSLDVHRPVIELLHLMGAKDKYIAGLFAKRTFVLSLVGGFIGLIITFPAILGIGSLVAGIKGGIISEAHLTTKSWGILASVPLFSAVLSTITARMTVKKTLLGML